MADVAATTDTTPAASAPDTGAAQSSPTVETTSTSPASVTADDTVARLTQTWDRLAGDSSSPTPATVPPPPAQAAIAPDGSPAVPATPKGPIPFPDHERVVKTTRTKTRNETLHEFGIGEEHKPTFVRNALVLGQLAETNPRQAIRLIQSLLGEEAAPAAAAQQPPADPEPEPDIPLADGSFVYSAKQQHAREQWFERQLMAKVEKTYGPMRDAHELQQLTAGQRVEAQNMVASAQAEWPMFDRLKPYIRTAIEQHQGPLTPTSLHQAYIRAFKEHGLRLQREDWEKERVSEVALKTRGSSARPSAAQPITPRVGKLSTRERMAQLYDRAEATQR